MQRITVHQELEPAGVVWRFLAVVVDTLVLSAIWGVALMVDMLALMGRSDLNPSDPAAAQELSREITRQIIDQQLGGSNLLVNVLLFGSLFIYYMTLETVFSASIGKLVFGMRVTAVDGSRPSGLAVLARNLIRVPEAMLFYFPAGVACAMSHQCQRLGDHVARTVVVRRRMTLEMTAPPAASPPRPTAGDPAVGPPLAGRPQPPAPPAAPGAETTIAVQTPPTPEAALDDALRRLTIAALTVRGAHATYLHFSELELAASVPSAVETGEASNAVAVADPAETGPTAGEVDTARTDGAPGEADALPDDGQILKLDETTAAADPDTPPSASSELAPAHADDLPSGEYDAQPTGDDQARYSAGYVGAWFALADAVAELRDARDQAAHAAAATGSALADAAAARPELAFLLQSLSPYLSAGGDDAVHDAFLAIARADLSVG